MTRPVPVVLLLLGLLASTGCNGLLGPPSGQSDPTTTLTPAPPPTHGPTYPPGVAATAVTDAFALVGAHADALRDRPYTVARNRSVSFGNGTALTETTERVRVAADPSRYRYRFRGAGSLRHFPEGSDGTLVRFSNGTVVAEELVVAGEGRRYSALWSPDGTWSDPARVHHGRPVSRERVVILFGRTVPRSRPPRTGASSCEGRRRSVTSSR